MSSVNAIATGIKINSIKVNDFIKIMCRYHQYFIYRYDGIVNAVECKSVFGITYIEKDEFDKNCKIINNLVLKNGLTPSRLSYQYNGEFSVHKFTLIQDGIDEPPDEYKYYKNFNDILMENICTINNTPFDDYNYDLDVSSYKINKFKYENEDVIFLPISKIICSKDESELDSFRTDSIMESTKPYIMLPPINVTYAFSKMFMVYNGEHRLNMSKKLGYTHLPVIIND